MARVHAEASAQISAEPEVIYNILADYNEGHPRILPEQYFSNLRVEQGGRGEGTVIAFDLKIGGNTTSYRARIEEPQPGRVLVERYANSDTVTTFTINLLGDGRSHVKIETKWTAASGIRGLAERLAAPGMLRKVYEAELRKLEEVASAKSRGGAAQ